MSWEPSKESLDTALRARHLGRTEDTSAARAQGGGRLGGRQGRGRSLQASAGHIRDPGFILKSNGNRCVSGVSPCVMCVCLYNSYGCSQPRSQS